MHESLQPQTYRLRRLHHYRGSELTPQSVAEHEEIIAAILRGDARAAMLTGQKNWQNAAVRVNEVLTRLGEYGKL
jgi:DNA-binding GntR family transcriptional regulator